MFKSARVKLTAWYLLIIMLVSLTFSAIIYKVSTAEVERFDRMQRFRLERRLMEGIFRMPDGQMRRFEVEVPVLTDLVEETKRRILFMLVAINSGILVLAGGLGYILAGRTLGPIQKMVDEQNRFVSDASHELKTPLTSLKSAFEVYLRDKKRTKADADMIVRESINEVDRLQSLSDSLLKLASYQHYKNRTAFTKMPMRRIINEAIKRVEAQAKKRKVTINAAGNESQVNGEAGSLTEMMVIFLDNAIKYSPENSQVSVTTHQRDGIVSVSISDTGIGIDNKDLPFIYDRFFRADSARTHNGDGGYGLGLAIAQKIVKAHGGSISVISKVSKGTTFTIHLPNKLSL